MNFAQGSSEIVNFAKCLILLRVLSGLSKKKISKHLILAQIPEARTKTHETFFDRLPRTLSKKKCPGLFKSGHEKRLVFNLRANSLISRC
jgi:hypothetical protein